MSHQNDIPQLDPHSVPAEWQGSEKEIQAAQPAQTTRRGFLLKVAVAVNALVGLVLATPILGFLVGPVLKKREEYHAWVTLGDLSSFPAGETRLAEYRNPYSTPSDGDTAKIACWVRHTDDNKFQVFAVNCAHLGCPVRWFAQSKLFLCPCHGGAYYADGSRASGPPPRGLFEYEHRVDGNQLKIYAGEMPTLSNEHAGNCCGTKPFVQIDDAPGGTTWQG